VAGPILATYSNGQRFANGIAGIIAIIIGSATRTVKVTGVFAVSTSPVFYDILRQSTLGAGGVVISPADVAHDQRNLAATAVATFFTAAPAAGVLIGNVSEGLQNFERRYGHQNLLEQPVILRGITDNLAVNTNGVGATHGVSFTWEELTSA